MASENATMPVIEGLVDERTALLGAQAAVTPSKKFYRPRPLWLVPFAVTAALVRGMTLAPRVQVYTQLSCQAIYRNSDTFPPPSLSSQFTPSPAISLSNLSASHFSSHDSSNEPTLLSFIQHSESPSSNPCASDPAVQAGAAQLQTAYMLVMGITSMLSTGWWGHFGERQGRMRVLAFSTFGLLLSDLTFTLISAPQTRFSPRAGQAMLLVAPLIEGLLGGWTSLQGATTAYLADCTSAGRSRAQVFARFNGVFYAGFAFGPAIGAWLLRHPLIDFGTSNIRGQSNIAGVFALAAVLSALNLLLVLFVFPESLHSKQPSSASANTEGVTDVPRKKTSAWSEFIAGFTHAARVFSPRMHTLPGGRRKRDISLTLLGASVFLYLIGAGIFQIKYLYAQHVYGWGGEQLSWYIFLAGGLRSITLLFLVPGVIAIFKPKRPENADPDVPPTMAQAAKEMRFDLSLARASLALDVLSHTMVSVAPISQQPMFVAFSVISSLGAGVMPTAQSIALGLVSQSPDEKLRAAGAGGVFGALAAVQAAGQMILGPLIFGTLYARTVGPYPRAIFNAAAAIVFVSLLTLSALQAPRAPKSRRRHEEREREERFRGRSRTPKDLRRLPIVPVGGQALGSGSGHDSFGSESASEAV